MTYSMNCKAVNSSVWRESTPRWMTYGSYHPRAANCLGPYTAPEMELDFLASWFNNIS